MTPDTPIQRQLAAIMFSDIVDYTAMMQGDEINTMVVRDKYRETLQNMVNKFDGQVLQHYGDGSLSTFSSSILAVQCALHLQEAFSTSPAVPVRIGIHSGDIVFEDGGIFGDGVNVASRIESLATKGSVLVSDKVFDDIKNQPFIKVQSLGEFQLKNVLRPIEVFAIANEGLNIPTRSEMKGKVKERIKSIAVLPFVNMSSDQDNEYFSDGISEEIINALVKIEGLRVTSRTSSFTFKGKKEDLRQIGKTLGVNSILEGSVRKSGERFRITAQLVNADDGFHLWSENFDGTMGDIFQIQDDISNRIATSLRERLSVGERGKSDKFIIENVEAYNTYLLGLYYQNKWTPSNAEKAVELHSEAIKLEPNFASPYEGLGSSYVILGTTGHMPLELAYSRAVEAAKKCLELDPASVESYLTLAAEKTFYQWDLEAGSTLVKKALEINPNSPNAHTFFSLYHLINRDFDGGLIEIEKALIIDPLSVSTLRTKADFVYLRGDFEESLTHYDRVLEINPSFQAALEFKGWAYLMIGEYDQALKIFESFSEASFAIKPDTQIGYTYALMGNQEEAMKYLNAVQVRYEQNKDFSLHYDLATLYAGLKDFEKTMMHLNECFNHRISPCIFMHLSPIWKWMHDKDEFKDLMKRIGVSVN